MNTKKSMAKEAQGYNPKPVFPMCSSYAHFSSDLVKVKGYFDDWIREQNLRCSLPGDNAAFAVKKTATCSKHQFKLVDINGKMEDSK